MKNLKKLASLFLALILTLGVMAPAFADETTTATETGSITINGVSEDNTYEIYKLLDLESYDMTAGAYSYKVNSAWKTFFKTEDALKYVEIDSVSDYVTWKAAEDDDTIATFAKLALAYAKNNSIATVKSSTNEGEFVITGTSGKFSALELGYYLIDSTTGALCGLTTTNPDASINAKNGQPTIDKQVKEDSTDNWGATNTADIGQTVEFRVTINVHAGAENYVLHDKMSNGLTFEPTSVNAHHVVPGTTDANGTLVENGYYQVVTSNLTDGCTFEIQFTQDFCDHLQTNDKVIVYYNAMLNRNAQIGGNPKETENDANPNEAWLEYGEENFTTHDKTQTYTYGIDIIKTDSQNTLINGAEFKIYDALTEGNEVAVVLMDDGVTYRRARSDEKGVSIVVKEGKVRVVGFDNGTYYLEETVNPAGYNKLTARQKFIISDANLDSIFNGNIYSTGSGVHVVNKSGTMLPETGGVGTTLFYVIGGVLVAGAVVLLVARKRMSKD